jgi:UDPglucose 6-dehydrogenase
MARKVMSALDGKIRGKTIAVLGLTFKPNTDDMREAPSVALITALEDFGASIRAFDPAGMTYAKAMLPAVTFCDGPYEAAEGADALVIVTEWEQFRALDLDRLKSIMAAPVLIDLKNVYQPEELARAGFRFEGIGRPDTRSSDPRAALASRHSDMLGLGSHAEAAE